METIKTKKCNHCGRELPITSFWKLNKTSDGLQSECKECQNRRREARKAKRVYYEPNDDSPLSKFKPVELIAELRRRGYTGKLYITREVDL